jgi:hypothetical protein
MLQNYVYTCSGSLASCEELMEIVANADKELQPERSHGDDEGSDADDISLQTIDSDSDDSAYEETDDEAVVAHSEEKERAGPTTQTSGALGISAAPSVDEGIIQSSSTSSTMQDESGHPRRIPRIATMPWLCPDNGPRQWIDITRDLVTLAVSKGTLGQPQANRTSCQVSRQQEGARRADVHRCRFQRRTDQMSLAAEREVRQLHPGIASFTTNMRE